jgi:hypothetical protein
MHYQSLDDFLNKHETAIAGIMERVQREVGGHYTRMTPTQLRTNARDDARYVIGVWRSGQADRSNPPETARQAQEAGINLDDLIRLVDLLLPAYVAYFEKELAAQPDLAADLIRRLRHTSASYRTNIVQAKLDQTLNRIKRP